MCDKHVCALLTFGGRWTEKWRSIFYWLNDISHEDVDIWKLKTGAQLKTENRDDMFFGQNKTWAEEEVETNPAETVAWMLIR